jgi:hypothetical protein
LENSAKSTDIKIKQLWPVPPTERAIFTPQVESLALYG